MITHQLNKVILEFSFGKGEEAQALQKTKALFYDIILPQLNKQFDAAQRNLYINKLEVVIGNTTEAEFENDFFKALIQSLEPYIHRAAERSSEENPSGFTSAQFLFFLEKGYWPWNMQHKHEKEITAQLRLFFEDERQVAYLLQKIQAAPAFFAERLIKLILPDTVLRNLLIEGLTKQHPAIKTIWPLLPVHWYKQAQTGRGFYYHLMRSLLAASPLQTITDVRILLRQIIPAVFSHLPAELKKLLASIDEKTDTPLPVFFTVLEKLSTGKGKKKITDHTTEYKTSSVVLPVITEESVADYFREDTDEKINILNAGLILFHPYLHHVFRDLKWTGESNKFLNAKTQQKAVLFLQYITNGKSRQAEHLLVLNKILCGWPVHLPLKTSCNFSVKEKAAAQELIESLKEHWRVLKNTSPQGVIESFIQRPGLLQIKDSGFLLQVEKRTIDVLLDTLPFGINTIKLPWNEKIIYTEW